MDFEEKDPRDYIQGSLSFVLWLKLFKKEEKLFKEFFEELDKNQEIKLTLQARVREMLQRFEAGLLVKNVKEEIQKLFHESRWWRLSLLGAQIFGLSTAGVILKYYYSLPPKTELPTGLLIGLGGYISVTLLSVILGVLRK